MRDIYQRIIAFFIALPLVFIIGSPIYFDAYHHNKLISQGSAVLLENGQRFDHPTECWLLTPTGIGVSCITLIALISLCIVLSKKFETVSLKLWLTIVIFGCLLGNAAPLSGYFEHKDDYFYIGTDKIEQRYGKDKWSILRKDIKYIKTESGFLSKDHNVFIIRYKDRKVRITTARLSKLNDNKNLRRLLKESVTK